MQGSSPGGGSGSTKLPANPQFNSVSTGTVLASGDVFANGVDITGIDHQSLPIAIRGRYSTSGPPTIGTWGLNDVLLELVPGTGCVPHLCTAGGTPGAWDGAAVTPPVVSAVTADTITGTTATLHGVVNPGGTATDFQFLYGTTSSYGLVSPILPTFADDDTNDQPVSTAITGLTAGTTYHFQLQAINPGGSVASSDFTFTTPGGSALPTVTVTGSSAITQTAATLAGTVIPNGLSTSFFIEYGLTTAYGTTAASGSLSAGFVTFPESANVTGLAANTLYHWQIRAVNANGTTTSGDQTFTTTNVNVPTVTTGTAGTITNGSAVLSGTVNPNSSATTYHYEVGLTTAYSLGHFPSSDASVGSGSSPVTPLAQTVSGLAPNTLYNFRIVATNAGGAIPGSNGTFTTTNTAIPAGFHRINYSPAGPLAQPRQSFTRYPVVILQRSGVTATDQSRIAAIKAENPGCKVLVYQDAYYWRSGSGGNLTDAIDPTIQNAHEAWFLHDSVSGARLQSPFAGDYIMFLGQTDMQSFVVSGVQAVVSASGFDGVFFDDLTANVAFSYPTKTYGQPFNATTNPRLFDSRFPVDASGNITPAGATAWQAGATYFLQNAATTLKNSGMLVYGNLGGTYQFGSLWQTWAQYLDGAMEESLGDNGQGIPASRFYVTQQLANLTWSEANGHKVLCNTLNSTELGQAYGLAMMLLVSNGHCFHGTQNKGSYTSEFWYGASGISGTNEYDNAILLGAASGAMTGTPSTGYMRLFAGGSASNVKLNPTSASLTIGGVSVPAYTGQINYVP